MRLVGGLERKEIGRTAVCGPVPHRVYVVAFTNEGAGGYRREVEVFDFIFDGFVNGCCRYESDIHMAFKYNCRWALTPGCWH